MRYTLTLLSILLFAPLAVLHAAEPPLNVLLITADDLPHGHELKTHRVLRNGEREAARARFR